MNGYILDTNVFNRVLDGQLQLPALEVGVSYFATHVQLDELAATREEPRRERLLEQFSSIAPVPIPTESFVLDVSRLDLARLGEGVLYLKIRDELNKRNKSKVNNAQDALIAETAINNALVLVTEDTDLLTVVSKEGGSAIRIHEIVSLGPDMAPSV